MTEQYIPVSVVKAKIAELEESKTDKLDIEFDDYDSPNYAINDKIKLLQSLLPKEPIPIGPTEADNWEYNGERWVKKEK